MKVYGNENEYITFLIKYSKNYFEFSQNEFTFTESEYIQ